MTPGEAKDAASLLKHRESMIRAFFEIKTATMGWASEVLALSWATKRTAMRPSEKHTGTCAGVPVVAFRLFLQQQITSIDARLKELGVQTPKILPLCSRVGMPPPPSEIVDMLFEMTGGADRMEAVVAGMSAEELARLFIFKGRKVTIQFDDEGGDKP